MGDKSTRLCLCFYSVMLLSHFRRISSIEDVGVEQPSHRQLQETAMSEVVTNSDTSRRLSQSNGPSRRENQFSCTFSRPDVARMYNERIHTWTVDDSILEELKGDIQSIVNCSSADDVISIQASTTVTPTTTLIIPWNLTITGSNLTGGNGNEGRSRVRERVEITCPNEGTLFVSRSNSFTVSDLVITSCRGNSSVIVVDPPCENGTEAGLVRFLNTDFTSHNLSGGGWILESQNTSCTRTLMHNVRLADNKCSEGVCTRSRGTHLNLSNVEVLRNRNNDGNSSRHGVFSLEDSEASISHMDSRRNRIRTFHLVGSTLHVSNSDFFRNNISYSLSGEEGTSGSVLYAVQSSVSVNGSVFRNNSAVRGGALFSSGTQINISDCVFDGNESPSGNGSAIFTQNGPAISLVSSVFTNNHGEFGAGVYSSNITNVEVVESDFTDNTCQEDGGGLFIIDGSVNIRYCDFRSNTALDDAAAVLTDRVNLTLLHTTFQYNNASFGGACFFRRTHSRNIRHVEFVGNQAITDGGGFYVTLSSDIQITDSRFANNVAMSNGGVFVGRHQSHVVLQRVKFYNNTANNHGGVCYITNVTFIARNVQVLTNRALQGDGGAFTLLRESRTFLQRVELRNNSANGTGGCCDLYYSEQFVARDVQMISNKANGDGGALYSNRGSRTVLERVEFRNNSANGDGGCCDLYFSEQFVARDVQMISNRANGAGGALNIYGGNQSVLQRVRLVDNTATKNGGGCYLSNTERFVARDVQLISNRALESEGGALSVYRGTLTVLHDVELRNNTASDDGGGCYSLHSDQLELRNVRMISNKALQSRGGGVFSYNTRVISVSNSSFEDNFARTYGGAMRTLQSIIRLSNNIVFRRNEAHDMGGALLLQNCSASLEGIRFESNWSPHGGSIWAGSSGSTVISECTFVNNTAVNTGGDVELSTDARVTISNTMFSGKSGQSGGAINLEYGSSLFISSCQFRDSNSTDGGAFRVWNSNLTIVNSSFVSCTSNEHGGAIFSRNSSIEVNTTRFIQNVARNGTGGAISLHDQGSLHGSQVILRGNHARSTGGSVHAMNGSTVLFEESSFVLGSGSQGGGISVSQNSTLLCYACNFGHNTAELGGALYVQSNDERTLVTQLQDTTFENNTAYLRGGGVFFERPQDRERRCTNSVMNCSRVVLLNVAFLNNYATFAGSGVFTTDEEGVLATCDLLSPPRLDFLDQDNLERLRPLHPDRSCTTWSGNSIREDSNGSVINTSGKTLNISISSVEDAELSVTRDNFYALHNIRSGRPLPQMNITVLDAFGYGPTHTSPDQFEVVLSSSSDYFRGIVVTNVTNGSGSFSSITGYGPADQYTLQISPRLEGLEPVEIVLYVRQCQIGEVSTLGGEFCQDCDSLSYNFNLTKTGTCSLCPERGTCEDRYIVPRDGTWHRGPCDAQIAECLLKEACSYKERKRTLQNLTHNMRTCEMEPSFTESYTNALCDEGYKGPLCGSCKADYGLSLGLRCAKCVHTSLSVLILCLIVLYLMIVAFITIRGALPVNKDRISRIIERRTEDIVEWNTSRSVCVNLEMVQMMRDGHVPPEYMQRMRGQNNPTPNRGSQLARECEQTKRQTIESFKVIINFLQVTSTAASIDVPWTSGILGMFEASEYIGALSTAGVSASIDCIVATDSASARSIWRMVLSLLVPGSVIIFLALFWVIFTLKSGKRGAYFTKRMALSLVVVVYISYLGLTELAVRTFYCVEVSDSENPFVRSKKRYWAMDTAVQCYRHEHLVLMGIALVVLFFVSLAFPLLLIVAFAKKKTQLQNQVGWIHETMGFLYTAFKDNLAFWESLVMLRKACLSIIVVFSYPLGGQIQGQLAILVLTACLYVHLLFTPYKNEYSRLNVYESISLFISIVTFTLGLLLSTGKCKGVVEDLIAFVVITVNGAFFLFVVVVLIRNGLQHCRKVLECEDDSFSDKASSWTVFKAYLSLVYSRCRA